MQGVRGLGPSASHHSTAGRGLSRLQLSAMVRRGWQGRSATAEAWRQRARAQLRDPVLSVTGRSYSPTRPLAAAPAFLGRSRSIKSVAVAQAISQGGRPCWGPTPSIRRHLSGIAQQQLGDASRWPEIFLLNPSIRHPTGLPRPGPDLPDNTPTQPPRLYSVRRGDTLSGIAQRERGAASRWPESLERNREVISNPDRIFPTRSSSSRPRCLPTEVVDLS